MGAVAVSTLPSTERMGSLHAAIGAIRRHSDDILRQWAHRHLLDERIAGQARETFGTTDTGEDYRKQYLNALLELFCGCMSGRGAAWTSVYLDERLRFVSDLARSDRYGVLRPLLRDDVASLLTYVPADLQGIFEDQAQTLHAPLFEKPTGAKLKLALVGDCIMTETRAFLSGLAREAGIDLDTRHEYFSASMGVTPNFDAVVAAARRGEVDVVALSYLTFEGTPPYRALLADAPGLTDQEIRDRSTAIVRTIRESLGALRSVTEVPVLLHNACGLPLNRIRKRLPFLPSLSRAERTVLDEINGQLRELAEATSNTFLIDEPAIVQDRGLRHASASLLPKAVTKDSVFHTSNLGPLLADSYLDVLKAYALLKKTKVLLVDFDNTLWNGVMAEGDVVHDVRAQKLLRELRNAGLLLVSLSKNDPRNIRWDEMVLDESDFVLHKVSWNHKAQSIEEVAQELNLGADSFVMIDDNPVERELVKQHLPAVLTLDPADASTWRWAEYMLRFPNTTQTEEARARTEMYRAAAARREATVANLDYPTMMASLALRAKFRVAKGTDLPRVHELIQRTNQFNTTTRRRSVGELEELMKDPAFRIYAAELGDRFGDLGLVGVVITERQQEEIRFDSVVMSCRAMGFGFERLLVSGPLADQGAWTTARGYFVQTSRNDPAASLFKDAGFEEVSSGEWLLPPGAPVLSAPVWLTVN